MGPSSREGGKYQNLRAFLWKSSDWQVFSVHGPEAPTQLVAHAGLSDFIRPGVRTMDRGVTPSRGRVQFRGVRRRRGDSGWQSPSPCGAPGDLERDSRINDNPV